ncbi:MAG: hypothetical protein U5K69_28540 [Balneolaceae bacterium]|nr:hypothetical protein [Balneolaceae bacterium]
MKLLVIEDNEDLLENILTYLEREGYICESAKNYDEGIRQIVSFTYHICAHRYQLPGRQRIATATGT